MNQEDTYTETESSAKSNATWQPKNKAERRARRMAYERYYLMQNDQNRLDAEQEWYDADKMFGQYIPTTHSDDWRAHLTLPDGFSAIQAHMQETIDRRSRPYLRRVEDSDRGIETFQNSVMTYNLNHTNFDYQYFLAKYSAAIRGTAYLMEYYRVDKRKIQDPTDVNDDGTLKYTEKEVTDFDDAYTEWVPNEFVFLDPAAKHIDECRDMVWREILSLDEFQRRYAFRKDFMNIERVKAGGDTHTKSFFRMPQDITEQDVEILHYYNRATDEYLVVANNILVRIGPLPTKHKELPITPIYHYMVPGRMFGLGVPKIIRSLTEERASIRNLNLDRQKMQMNKMFVINDQADFADEDLVTRPHGMIEVSTNGLSIRDTILPLEYGDVPQSYFRTEEILLEDIRRAHGIDDRIQGVNSGGTATEAAILKETAQKRINLIATAAEMDSMIRIGRLKWSNIQFFYPVPKIERVTEDNEQREKKVLKKISVDGKEFTIQKKSGGGSELKVNDLEGSTTFKLDKAHAVYLEGETDIIVDAESTTVLSKPLQQAKITEMLAVLTKFPQLLPHLDNRKTLTRVLEVNQESPKAWMTDNGKSDDDWRMLADNENQVMKAGVPLAPTDNATTIHTEEHLNYAKTAEFQSLPQEIQAIFTEHIMGEHDANPITGNSADLLGGAGMPPIGPPGMTGPPGAPGAPGMPGGGAGSSGAPLPSIQPGDMTPSTVFGETPNNSAATNPVVS